MGEVEDSNHNKGLAFAILGFVRSLSLLLLSFPTQCFSQHPCEQKTHRCVKAQPMVMVHDSRLTNQRSIANGD